MKNKLLFVLIASIFSIPAFAQQKVRDNTVSGAVLPHKDALLELESTNKGLLHTRIPLIRTDDAAPLSQHLAGMMVYNTATVNDVIPGIYYNNGNRFATNNTALGYDPATGILSYTNTLGVTEAFDLSAIVEAQETLTALGGEVATNIDGDAVYRITYTDEDGDDTELDITANNGLQIDEDSGAIKLGGSLTESTTINTDGNMLAITGLEYSTAADDKIVAADATTGELKALKAAMPKFFYMPSIIIPTAEDQLEDPNDFGEIDLYEMYRKQFAEPMQSNPTKTTTLPVLPRTELDYYITWFDENVFETVSVSDLGILMYTVKDNADVTVGSFMNIVFAVKP